MKENDEVYLKHILDAIERIEEYCEGVSKSRFLKNKMAAAAVVRELEIIGEAANYVSKEFQAQFPGIQWRQLVGLRNLIVHQYFGIDYRTVWEIIQDDLPVLKKQIENLILELEIQADKK